MDKYELLRKKLNDYIQEIQLSIRDMQADLNDEKVADNMADARRLFELTVENIETRVAVMEMYSVIEELTNILKEVE